MQSFLPYPNFVASAQVLDRARLGKQRVEGRQMQTAIQEGSGWSNHPCTKMWSQHVTALMMYTDCCIKEWIRRGYENNMPLMLDHSKPYFLDIEMPPWLGDERLHSSHRAALLHKDPEWYSQFDWTEEPKLEYFWPTVEETT
jgi:hypothetical protein